MSEILESERQFKDDLEKLLLEGDFIPRIEGDIDDESFQWNFDYTIKALMLKYQITIKKNLSLKEIEKKILG